MRRLLVNRKRASLVAVLAREVAEHFSRQIRSQLLLRGLFTKSREQIEEGERESTKAAT